MPHEPTSTYRPSRAWLALLLLVPAPTIGVVAAMVLPETRGTTLGRFVYAASKLWILALPAIWFTLADRRRVSIASPGSRGLLAGIGSGLCIAAAIALAYLALPASMLDTDAMRTAAAHNGLLNPVRYWALAVYLIVINSLLEEYVWRWFVQRSLATLVSIRLAIAAAAGCFTLHHYVALSSQTTQLASVVGSAGVFAGGVTWSWLFARYGTIWPGYLSHMLADIAVFAVAYDILFGW